MVMTLDRSLAIRRSGLRAFFKASQTSQEKKAAGQSMMALARASTVIRPIAHPVVTGGSLAFSDQPAPAAMSYPGALLALLAVAMGRRESFHRAHARLALGRRSWLAGHQLILWAASSRVCCFYLVELLCKLSLNRRPRRPGCGCMKQRWPERSCRTGIGRCCN